LYLPLPSLPASTQKTDSIQIGTNQGSLLNESDDALTPGSKWVDEEERRFFEDIPDLREFVPASVLGVDAPTQSDDSNKKEEEKDRVEREKEEVRKLEEELKNLEIEGADSTVNIATVEADAEEDE
jgi:regulator of nonsense transcripts 2